MPGADVLTMRVETKVAPWVIPFLFVAWLFYVPERIAIAIAVRGIEAKICR